MGLLSIDQSQLHILGSVALAMVLGAAIGFEREMADKPAGLRTHMLVSGAAALFVALGDIMVEHFNAALGDQTVQSDPIRVLEAVITGVSFLGAGTIIRRASGHQIEGLTTAASLLVAAAVGVTIALSQQLLAIGLTSLVLITLHFFGRLEAWLLCRLSQSHQAQQNVQDPEDV